MSAGVDILLVDDEPRNLDALEVILAGQDYRLLRACDADTALRLLIENDVAAILLDIKMPGTSGFELARMIKSSKRHGQIPILFLTAHHFEERDVATGYGAGAVDYLTKPLNPTIVRHKVAAFADLFRKTRALAELNEKLEVRVRERTAELEKSEAALREADRKKDEFIAVLAHELRNPLAPIRFGLDILGRVLSEKDPVVEGTLTRMSRQLDHMVRLIDDLLDISRIRGGTIELKRTCTDLQSIVQVAIDVSRAGVARRKQTLRVELRDTAVTYGDSTRLAQIVGNLLHNATKFTPEGGEIAVHVGREGDAAVIRVVDSGEGIAADQIDRAFQMFTRISRPDSGAERGLGIGLALGRKLAEMHGGTLTASSDGPGRGSTFTLRLPALELVEPAPDASTPRALDATGTPLEVVVIEDSEDAAETLASWLEAMGHHVAIAQSGRSGIELVEQRRPDVVFCDIGLPEMDGVEVCRRVRRLSLATRPWMVALTGWGREDDRRRTRDAGFDQHLVKPVGADQLQGVLRGVRA